MRAVLFLTKILSLDISPYIRELILLNECVILRGVGGFETCYKHASLNKDKNILVPPTKEITFRPDWVQDNGVLEEHLMKILDIERKEASEIIDSFITDFYEKIKEQDEIELKGIGVFTVDERLKLKFRELEEENYLADSFGLDVLEFDSTKFTPPTPKVEGLTPVELKGRKLTGWYVTIGVLLLVISVTFIILISESSVMGLLGFTRSDQKAKQNKLIVIGGGAEKHDDPVLIAIEQSIDSQTNPQKALTPDYQKQPRENQAQYFLIAGSFKNSRNAEYLKDQLQRKGFSSEIHDTGTNYRVVIGQFTNRRNAINELRRVRSQLDQSVWLLEVN